MKIDKWTGTFLHKGTIRHRAKNVLETYVAKYV